MMLSARAWLEDFSDSLRSLALFTIAYRRRLFARKRAGAPSRTRIQRQNELASTHTALWSISFRLMILTRESNEVEWDNYFGSRMSTVIEHVRDIVGDVPTWATELGPVPPPWGDFKPYAKWLAGRSRIRQMVAAARCVKRYLGESAAIIPHTTSGSPEAVLGENLALRAPTHIPAKNTHATPRKSMKEPSRKAFAAYRLVRIAGMKQREVEKRLSVDQSTVSRWVKQVVEWVEEGNVLPDEMQADPTRRKPMAMDPSKLDQGPRLDRRRDSGRRKEDE